MANTSSALHLVPRTRGQEGDVQCCPCSRPTSDLTSPMPSRSGGPDSRRALLTAAGCTGFLKWCRWPQIWWLGGAEIYSPFWRPKVWNAGVRRVTLRLKALGESPRFPRSLWQLQGFLGLRSQHSIPARLHTALPRAFPPAHLGLDGEPTQMIQGDLILRFLITSAEILFPNKVTGLQGFDKDIPLGSPLDSPQRGGHHSWVGRAARHFLGCGDAGGWLVSSPSWTSWLIHGAARWGWKLILPLAPTATQCHHRGRDTKAPYLPLPVKVDRELLSTLQMPGGGAAAVFRLVFGFSSVGQPSVCGHSQWSRGAGSFLKPPPPLLISTCHSAMPGWSFCSTPTQIYIW